MKHMLPILPLLLAAAAGAQTPADQPAREPVPPPPPAKASAALAATYATSMQARDAADTLWRNAREALNRTEYRVAASLFRQLREKHPTSRYTADAAYWEAFSLYRIGTADDLRNALAALRAAQASGGQSTRESLQSDAVSLATRIQGALAQRGDPAARRAIDSVARQPGALCDREEISVRVEALSALAQMDEAQATPVLRRVLEKRDACSVELRRRAIYLLIRNNADSAAPPILLDVVRNDPELEVRAEAVHALSQLRGARATQALQQVLQTSRDERVQATAVRALAGREDWAGLRAYIERSDVPTTLRAAAISGVGRQKTGASDVAWLRQLYTRASEAEIKSAVVSALARQGGDENERWLASLARNAAEPLSVRTTAISHLGRTSLPAAEFVRIYDAASERPIREQLVGVLAGRKEPEALDKLIDIARTGTDPVVRQRAINYLSRHKSDPRVQKLLLDLVDQGAR